MTTHQMPQMVQQALRQASQRSMEIARAMSPTQRQTIPEQRDKSPEQPSQTKTLQTLLDCAK